VQSFQRRVDVVSLTVGEYPVAPGRRKVPHHEVDFAEKLKYRLFGGVHG
jgi:hypothetical protein